MMSPTGKYSASNPDPPTFLVETVSDPDFSICKDYIARGLDLILDTEERPQLLQVRMTNA